MPSTLIGSMIGKDRKMSDISRTEIRVSLRVKNE